MIGRKLLHYEIVAHVGAGGMGDVWRAHDTRLDREVAIKILAGDFTRDTVQKQRFFREARAASALVHPNIITVHEINSADGIDFIVMDVQPVSELRAGKLPIPQALSCAFKSARRWRRRIRRCRSPRPQARQHRSRRRPCRKWSTSASRSVAWRAGQGGASDER
jgi:serine/threonine protein kinase